MFAGPDHLKSGLLIAAPFSISTRPPQLVTLPRGYRTPTSPLPKEGVLMSFARRSSLALTCCALLWRALLAGQTPGVLSRFKDEPGCDLQVISKRPTRMDPPTVTELRLEGVWGLVSMEWSGQKLPQELLNGVTVTFRDGKARWDTPQGSEEESYRVDLNKPLPALDFGTEQGTRKGIFVWRGNTLTVCFCYIGEGRPTTFKAPTGSNQILWILRRKTP
jgi:uncharacterized protein (TIGR03067 family)